MLLKIATGSRTVHSWPLAIFSIQHINLSFHIHYCPCRSLACCFLSFFVGVYLPNQKRSRQAQKAKSCPCTPGFRARRGEVLELLADEGLTLRHHWWHSLNNFPVVEKEKQTLRKQWMEGNFLPLKNTNCHHLISYLVNSKWIIDLNIKPEAIKGSNLRDHVLGKDF